MSVLKAKLEALPDQSFFKLGQEVVVSTVFAHIRGVVQGKCDDKVHTYDQCLRLVSIVFLDGGAAPPDFDGWITAQREVNFSGQQSLPVFGIIHIHPNGEAEIEISVQMEFCW